MLAFDKENKITFEQLSFSLQDKLRKMVTRADIDKVDDIITSCEESLNGVRFSFVSSLDSITSPVNGSDVAVLNNSGTLTLYAYANNRWVKIPNQDVYHTLAVTQSSHQLITVLANSKSYTSTVNLVNKSEWTASIKADNYYIAGNLNKTSGTLTANDSVYASTAEFNYTPTITANIAKLPSGDTYGVRLNWTKSSAVSSFFGSFDPSWILDELTITKNGSSYSSIISFYGSELPPSNITTVNLTLTANDTNYTILSRTLLSNFTSSGDLLNSSSFTTSEFYELFKSLKGKSCELAFGFNR